MRFCWCCLANNIVSCCCGESFALIITRFLLGTEAVATERMALIFPTFTSVFPWWPFVFRAWLLCYEREGHTIVVEKVAATEERKCYGGGEYWVQVSSGSHHLINPNVPRLAGHSWRISMLLLLHSMSWWRPQGSTSENSFGYHHCWLLS